MLGYRTHIFILIPIIMVYDYLSCSSHVHINIFVIIGVNYPIEGKAEVGGLTCLGILDGGVPPGSPNPDLILDQKIVIFPHPFSDLASKTHTRVFRPGL